MNRSNMAKVLAAFVAGVVLTMGSLIYLRTRELSRFRKASQTARFSAAPVANQVSASDNPPADLKASNQPVERVEATSASRVSRQVPERVVPKVARSNRFRNGGRGTAQNTARGRAPHTAPASEENDNAWRELPQTIPGQVQQLPFAATTPERKPRVVTLQRGTSLAIRLEETVATDRNRSGDMFRASLDSPLIVNGFVLAERGARVLGQVEKAKRARLLGSRADLSLRLREITMADGQRAIIETTPWEQKGAHASIGDASKMAAGAAFGAVAGALTGAAKGAGFVSDDAGARKGTLIAANKRSLVLTSGARLTFRVARPLTITERLGTH
jgi:hypothetical protein